jgi:hypothetical protein
MKKRMSRKAKIRRVKTRRSKLRFRNLDMVGIINRNGGGAHTGLSPSDRKAPNIKDWD